MISIINESIGQWTTNIILIEPIYRSSSFFTCQVGFIDAVIVSMADSVPVPVNYLLIAKHEHDGKQSVVRLRNAASTCSNVSELREFVAESKGVKKKKIEINADEHCVFSSPIFLP